MKCQWKWCCEEATVIITRALFPQRDPALRYTPRKKWRWHETLATCDNCSQLAREQQFERTFVRVKDFDANYGARCWS